MDKTFLDSYKVSIIQTDKAEYPLLPPFDPDHRYPEYPFHDSFVSSSPNYAYSGVRESFFYLKLDIENYGKSTWNPYDKIIKPGDRVALKPNFVYHKNKGGSSIDSVITHGSIIRAVLDYVIIALKGKGEICIADAPQSDAHFEKIVDISGTKEVVDALRKRTNIPIILLDLRKERVIEEDGLIVGSQKLKGDPAGYISVNLKEKSFFYAGLKGNQRFRGSDYDVRETSKHHNKNTNEYLISRTIVNSDVLINIPKLKTHRKTGVTVCLKNLIGMNGDKNWIPHFQLGGPSSRGDEHSSKSRLRDFECFLKDKSKLFISHSGPLGIFLSRKIRKIQKSAVEHSHLFDIRGGSWYGNDTLWRSILDLNNILFFASRTGDLQQTPQRKYFCVVDGIIAGQGEGPYHTSPISTGCIIAGSNPISIDLIAILFMGFDYKKIPKVFNAVKSEFSGFHLDNNRELYSNNLEWKKALTEGKPCFRFTPPKGWSNHIELI